jgi:hypothetical protein
MRPFLHHAHRFFQAGLVLALTNACQASPETTSRAASASSQQLIVKFKRSAACDQAGVAQFSGAAGVPLVFVRTMSGDACVVMQSGANPQALARGLDALRKNPAIEWAEPDAVMKTQ